MKQSTPTDAFPHSEHREFPRELAEYIREALPELWSKHGTGGNPPTAFTGDRAYKLWELWLRGDRSPEVVDWATRRRDAYASRHRNDFRKGGVIAAIKWGVVLPVGVHAMVAELPLEDPEEPVVRNNRRRARRNANSPVANWRNINLRGADLSYMDMSGADIHHADLSDTNLSYANLSGANLMHANFKGANMTGASLKGAKGADVNLDRVYLSGADLTDVSLPGVYMREANLRYATLTRAKLRGADLMGTDFTRADMDGTDLCESNLGNARLEYAGLAKANLIFANLSGANLSTSDLSHADLSGADLTHADLQGAFLTGTILTGVELDGATLWPKDFTPPLDPKRHPPRRNPEPEKRVYSLLRNTRLAQRHGFPDPNFPLAQPGQPLSCACGSGSSPETCFGVPSSSGRNTTRIHCSSRVGWARERGKPNGHRFSFPIDFDAPTTEADEVQSPPRAVRRVGR